MLPVFATAAITESWPPSAAWLRSFFWRSSCVCWHFLPSVWRSDWTAFAFDVAAPRSCSSCFSLACASFSLDSLALSSPFRLATSFWSVSAWALFSRSSLLSTSVWARLPPTSPWALASSAVLAFSSFWAVASWAALAFSSFLASLIVASFSPISALIELSCWCSDAAALSSFFICSFSALMLFRLSASSPFWPLSESSCCFSDAAALSSFLICSFSAAETRSCSRNPSASLVNSSIRAVAWLHGSPPAP
mmetsp:Transcript_116461/g.330017  ORF Transcript_116461/g.330017 Transcript_116461/m.330017 type:complete len:250 (-) Transcript_116461:142-891(-)